MSDDNIMPFKTIDGDGKENEHTPFIYEIDYSVNSDNELSTQRITVTGWVMLIGDIFSVIDEKGHIVFGIPSNKLIKVVGRGASKNEDTLIN